MIRGNSGWWISGVLASLFLFMLVDAAVRGEWTVILLTAPWMCVALIICWALLIRPRLVVSRDALTVVNVFRTHTVPWHDIDGLAVRYQLIVTLIDGNLIRAWGSPTTHPQGPRGQTDEKEARARRFVGVVEAIERTRDVLGRPGSSLVRASRRFDWEPLAALGAAAVVGLITARLFS
ncbi:MAG: PH domain-containing protein [Candidatus Microbacterium colombiense]|nr:MAG: PH domain-containing protein [Microbacterium sp.]